MNETRLRERMAEFGRSLFQRGYGCGSSGNISVRLDDGILVTPTNSCLGTLDPAQIAKVDWDGQHLSGGQPSKEAFLHLAMYGERPGEGAVVHLHATHSVAVSCLEGIDNANVLPPITAYYAMRVGTLPLLPYYRPGDPALAGAVREAARSHHAMLLANHGPVVAGKSLEAAVYNAEELEETAKLYLLLRPHSYRCLTPAQLDELRCAFPPS
jgi:ribulose-5-phosphate 4-epimerase/fuculose-1-phosphate aldolase